jgi:hypothetical protein
LGCTRARRWLGIVFIEAGKMLMQELFNPGHECRVIIPQTDYSGSCGSNYGTISWGMLSMTWKPYSEQHQGLHEGIHLWSREVCSCPRHAEILVST